jgi:hypothetical protein
MRVKDEMRCDEITCNQPRRIPLELRIQSIRDYSPSVYLTSHIHIRFHP